MARTLIVSDRNNSFFTANNIKVGTEIPTSGTYSKGDIVVNIGNNTATEAMWICVEAGTPGTWEVVGAGAGGGSGSIVAINDTVTVNNSVTEVSLGNLVGKISSSDKLIVHYNSTHLMEGVDYKVNSEGTRIVKLTEGSWNESGEQALFAFELFKNVESVNGNEIVVDTKLTSIVNNMMVTAPTTEVEIGVEGFDKNSDTLLVFKNGVIMVEGVDYNVNEDNTKIISINEVWNESNVEEYGITFVVFKEVVIYDESIGGITMGMLGSDVRETLNNLTETTLQHSNLLEAIDEKYATKEDLGNIEVDLSPYQQKTDNNLQTSSKDVVGAINELFQSANNGKELIASAIGEPLNAEDTFSAMSNDINGLLSTFKTNMMNNGVTVNSSDKFKALIDKIATLVDSEGKALQMAEGTLSIPNMGSTSEYTKSYSQTINLDLDFQPNVIFIKDFNYTCHYDYYNGGRSNARVWISNVTQHISTIGWGDYINISLNGKSLTVVLGCSSSGYGVFTGDNTNLQYWAFGVGEEDTTLRDSLADILENKGVDVTEEDDMASLITKVDNISGGLDIISATELPATGNNMQLCAITDNVTNSFILSNDEADVKISGTDIGIQLSELTMYDKYSYPMGDLTINLRIATTYQNASAIPLWLYYNNAWVQICSTKVIAINNKILQDGFTMGTTNRYGYYGETDGLVLKPGSSANLFGFTPFNNTIDFSKYKAIRIKGTYKNTTSSTGTYGPGIGIFGRSTNLGGGTSSGAGYGLSSTTSTFDALFSYTKTFNSSVTTSTPFDFTFDISKTNTCYLGIVTAMTEYTYITDLEFILK